MKNIKQSGLTLVEVLVALVLVGISGIMFSYMIGGLGRMREAERDTVALNYARSYVDTVRGLWRDPLLYNSGVLPTTGVAVFPSGYSVKVSVLSSAVSPSIPSSASYDLAATYTTPFSSSTVAYTANTGFVGSSIVNPFIIASGSTVDVRVTVTTPSNKQVSLSSRIVSPVATVVGG